MAETPKLNDIEIEYWDDGDGGDDEDTNTINADMMALEMQQQIAEEIKQQQIEQRKLQQKRRAYDKPIPKNNKKTQKRNPDITINSKYKLEGSDKISFSYNDIVTLNDGRDGKIKFSGTLGFESDTWCGLILSKPTGSHNGCVKQRKYWSCKPNHGTFVKRNQIHSIKIHRIGERFTIHEKVKTPKGKAYIRFIGNICTTNDTSNANEHKIEAYHENRESDIYDNENVMYGVELIDQMGENSGSVGNEYYFTCAHYRGMFYKEKDLIWIAPDAPPTPRISRKQRKKLRSNRRNKKSNQNKAGDSMELIGLDENNKSIDLPVDAFDDETMDDSDDSLSDSSSDDQFFSSDDVKRISLLAHGKVDDRMSFARILSDFKNVQKDTVRSMAQRWEKISTSQQQQRFSTSDKREKSEVELAQDIINESKRKRADTLPPKKNGVTASPIYQPPRFADSMIQRSKQYKNRKMRKNKTNELMNRKHYGAQSTPVSPNFESKYRSTSTSTSKSHAVSPHNDPTLHKSVSATGGSFARVAPAGKKRGKGKARKRAGKKGHVQFDEVGGSAVSTPLTPFMISANGISMDGTGSPSPITLSPATSNGNTHTITEEVDIEQEDPPTIAMDIHMTRSRNSIDEDNKEDIVTTHVIPFSQLSASNSNTNMQHTVTLSNINTTQTPVDNTNNMNTASTVGYTSPGIISPGGGMPSLTLQNSASLDLEQHDSVAVVYEMNKLKNKLKSQVQSQSHSHSQPHSPDHDHNNNSGGTGIPSADQILKSNSMSPTATNTYAWVFKASDDHKQKYNENKDEFKLKLKPDSPFDISSTQKDFQKVAELLLLECNNPKNLFKVLKGVCSKLKLSDPKYRRIDTMNSAVQNKLLKFEGAEEFLQLLGFKQNNMSNPTFWCCDMDQPPISVLESAIHICNDCLLKCTQKRATMDMLKKFSKHDLKNHRKKRKKKRNSRKHNNKSKSKSSKSKQNIIKRDKSMDTLSENTEIEDKKQNNKVWDIVPNRHRNGSVNVDGTVVMEKEKNINDIIHINTKPQPQPQPQPQTIPLSKPCNIVVNHLSPQDSFDMDGTEELESPNSSSYENNKQNYNNISLPTMTIRTQSIRIDDATEALSNLDDIKFELELEGGDEDRFQLSDIIWSVTHKDNTDKDARGIILLCFPTFSSSDKLIKCLMKRFFEPEIISASPCVSRENSVSFSDNSTTGTATTNGTGDGSPKSSTISTTAKFDFANSNSANARIESLWEVQVKVIAFLQQWMRTYWAEDWDISDRMLDIVEQFCIKIENCYKNDPNLTEKDVKKGMKLIKMIHQTMDFQEASLRSKKKKHASLIKQISIPSKFDRMTEMGTAVKKMRYDFVKLDNKRLAEQITLLDFKYFQAINKRECLGQHWKKSNKYEVAPNICALIDQFNKMSKWVQATILLAKNVKTRGRLIKKFIKVSNHLLILGNFQSLCAFHGALSSVPIHKLKHAWTYVPAKHIARFEEMRVIFNTRNNMGNLRKLHREAHAPLVPYTGIFLSDLVSIEEGNKKHKEDGTVNFSKLMRLSNAIDNILLYQRTHYEIADDIAVQSLLLEDFKINAKLDADYIYTFSSIQNRKDQPKKPKSVLSIFSK